MTDYSRFIAYIYEYVNGIKQYNAGFTKVEVRNGICKLQLMIKNTGRETKVKVYGLVREGGWLLGILLGEGQTQRQRLDLRMMTDLSLIHISVSKKEADGRRKRSGQDHCKRIA